MNRAISFVLTTLIALFFWLLIYLFAAFLTTAKAGPFNPTKSYCNGDAQTGPLNRVCYGHDICYANPKQRTRLQCDMDHFLTPCRKVASTPKCTVMYTFIRTFGWLSWDRSRDKDEAR